MSISLFARSLATSKYMILTDWTWLALLVIFSICCSCFFRRYNYKSKRKDKDLRFYDVKLIVRVQWHDDWLLLDDVAGIGCIYTPILHPALPMFLKVNDDQMAFFSLAAFLCPIWYMFLFLSFLLSVLFEFIPFLLILSYRFIVLSLVLFQYKHHSWWIVAIPIPNMTTTCSSVWFCSSSKLFFTNKHSFYMLILNWIISHSFRDDSAARLKNVNIRLSNRMIWRIYLLMSTEYTFFRISIDFFISFFIFICKNDFNFYLTNQIE